MFLELVQRFLSFLEALLDWIRKIVGVKDDQADSKKFDWANQYHNGADYFQPQLYNPNQTLNTHLRQRGLPMDVDRNTNQESQSSAVTLPRPFYAPMRQSPHLTKRAGNNRNQKPSLVELLLEQQKEAAATATSSLDVSSTENNGLSAESEQNRRIDTTTLPADDEYDCSIAFGDTAHSAPATQVCQPPPLAPQQPEHVGGLRGSRPLVKLNRMQFIAQMAKEGKDGDRMGDYAPDSQYSSVDLSSIRGGTAAAAAGSTDPPASQKQQPALSRLRNLSSAYPTLSLNDLSLLTVIGGGGFGQVWKGTWGGTPVAVKLLNNLILPQGAGPVPPEQEQLLAAFEEEVSMLAQLRHPNICLFLGVCLEPPHRAIVTELVSRGSLWDCLRIPNLFQQKSLPWPVGILRRILEGAGRGLIYLHGHSPPIIHRDLKSANLLLDETFNVKICDFGLARLRDYNTVLTANVGTIHWMAPEVLTGNQYNESADMYSIGIVMWEMFTGQCPYDGMKQVEVALSVVQRGLRPVIPTTCTTAQADLIRRCWDTDPAKRLSAAQLLQEVDTAFPAK